MRFYPLNSLTFRSFLQQWDFTLVVYLPDHEFQTELIIDELTKAATNKFPRVGFGFVTSELANRQLHLDEDVCITPLVKFYQADGTCSEFQWVGLEEITAKANPIEISKAFESLTAQHKRESSIYADS